MELLAIIVFVVFLFFTHQHNIKDVEYEQYHVGWYVYYENKEEVFSRKCLSEIILATSKHDAMEIIKRRYEDYDVKIAFNMVTKYEAK